MSKPSEGQKKIAALNLKNMLSIFTIELDKVIKRGDPEPQTQPPQQVPVQQPNPAYPGLDDFPIVVDPPIPVDMPPMQSK